MSCDVGEVTERLENELCYDYNYELCSFSNFSVTSPLSQLTLQPFHRFTYVTAHSPTLPVLHLWHSSFSNPSFASPMSQALHLIHLASRPWIGDPSECSIGSEGSVVMKRLGTSNIVYSFVCCLHSLGINCPGAHGPRIINCYDTATKTQFWHFILNSMHCILKIL